jgi:voltage-gated sodium channel
MGRLRLLRACELRHHREGEKSVDRLRKIVDDPRTERVVMSLIIVNAVILGLETNRSLTPEARHVLEVLDYIILGIFVIELAARIAVRGLAFFRDPWSVFDFVVVGIALVPATETFSVLRTLRVLRLLRLITVVPALRRVVAGLLASLPGMGSIVLLIGLLYYVFAIMANKLFGDEFPSLFGSLASSLFTLFTVMTLEGWVDGVVKPIMEKYPYAWAFFIPFIIMTTFMVLNLFIGVVVNAMQSAAVQAEAAEREAERQMIGEETAPLADEIRNLKVEVIALRAEVASRLPKSTG